MGDPNYPDDIHEWDNTPGSPFYRDLTDTPEYQDAFDNLLNNNASDKDICIEAVGEVAAFTAQRVSDAFLAYRNKADNKHLIEIGRIIYVAIERYCTPNIDDVLDEISDE